MLIIDSNDKVQFNVNDLKFVLNQNMHTKFLAILSENNRTEEELLKNETSSIILIDENNFFVCHMKEIAGLRFVILNNSKMDFSLVDDKVWNRLETAAKYVGADLIQLEVPIEKIRTLKSCKSVLMENYIFDQNIGTEILPVEFKNTPLDFEDKNILEKLANFELMSRLTYPSSTVRSKDNFSAMLEEYSYFSSIPGIAGFCIENDPNKGFIIWWSDLKSKTALGVHIWVSEKHRGKSYGKSLLHSMINQMVADKITTCSYFISASNISSIKNVLKSESKLSFVILNKHVGKLGKKL